jgi:hypothetical protein
MVLELGDVDALLLGVVLRECLIVRQQWKEQAGVSLRNDIPGEGRSGAGSRAEHQERRPF